MGMVSKENELLVIFGHLLDKVVSECFPELSHYRIRLRLVFNENGDVKGMIVREGNAFTIYINASFIEDDVDAMYAIAHELAHVLIDPMGVPSGNVRPKDIVEYAEFVLEDVIADFIAYRRLCRAFANDRGRLLRLQELYLRDLGEGSHLAAFMDLKEVIIRELRGLDKRIVRRVVREYFNEDNVEVLNELQLIELFKYVRALKGLLANR